jgi:hypothetical protein
MEGTTATIALLLAVAAIVVATTAAAIVVRQGRQAIGASAGGARTSELERRIAQLARRLELVESEMDTERSRDGPGAGGETAGTLRTAGVALSHVGLVRFDAFEDAGGAQSFALALIDDDGDGIVLTSLHSRQTTRLFVKGIRRGVADLPLSIEEDRAMRNAGIVPSV